MLLSYIELCEIVEQGVITNVDPKLINGSSIDVTLGDDLLVEDYPEVCCPRCGASQQVSTDRYFWSDVRHPQLRMMTRYCDKCGTDHPIAEYIKPISLRDKEAIKYKKESINHGYVLWPGCSCLAHTEQLFYMPADLSADYRLNSTSARSFLEQLHAAWMDPYWSNSALTLELVNLNRYHPIILHKGQKLGQVVFMRHTSVPEERSYKIRGRYNNTTTVSGGLPPVE